MLNKKISPIACILALCLSFMASAFSGDLSPPPGPIQPTNKVQILAQSISLPYTISSPGSYKLTSNITGVSGEHGIIIGSGNVTLDLNGFCLKGVAGSLNAIAVQVTANSTVYKNVVVKNGNISDWGGAGVHLTSFNQMTQSEGNVLGARLEDLIVKDCGLVGIRSIGHVHCFNSAVESCGIGYQIGASSSLRNCTAINNSGIGFVVLDHSTMSECIARQNGEVGIYGGSGLVISKCSIAENVGGGIEVSRGSRINNCALEDNSLFGIKVDFASLVTGCTIYNTEGDGVLGSNVGQGAPNCIDGNHIISSSGWGINLPSSPWRIWKIY